MLHTAAAAAAGMGLGLFSQNVGYAVVTCKIKLFQNYLRSLLQLMNIFQHVHCRSNNFEIISAAEIILFQFQAWSHIE